MNRVRVEDALAYLDEIRAAYNDQPLVYTNFLDIMRDFKSQTIGSIEVMRRVVDLFRAKPEFIRRLNTFLPAGFEVRIDGEGKISMLEPYGNVTNLENDSPCLDGNAYTDTDTDDEDE